MREIRHSFIRLMDRRDSTTHLTGLVADDHRSTDIATLFAKTAMVHRFGDRLLRVADPVTR